MLAHVIHIQRIILALSFFLKLDFIWGKARDCNLRFTVKLRERYRFPLYLLPHTCIASPNHQYPQE